jgi:RecA-family ATPase
VKRIIKLTESDLMHIVRRVIQEQETEMEEGWLTDKVKSASRKVQKMATSKPMRPREYFINDLLDIEDEVKENPTKFTHGDNWESLKNRLIAKAFDSNFSGQLVKKPKKESGKLAIDYELK